MVTPENFDELHLKFLQEIVDIVKMEEGTTTISSELGPDGTKSGSSINLDYGTPRNKKSSN